MYAVDAVVEHARGAAEHEHVARPEDEAPLGIAAGQAANMEGGIVAEGNRYHGRPCVLLVLIAHAADGLIRAG